LCQRNLFLSIGDVRLLGTGKNGGTRGSNGKVALAVASRSAAIVNNAAFVEMAWQRDFLANPKVKRRLHHDDPAKKAHEPILNDEL